MKGLIMEIVESLLEHWVITLLGSLGTIVATFFGWIYRTYLKDCLVSLFSKKQPIYTQKGSIETVLKGYLRRLAASENDLDLNVTIDYKNLDRKLHIEKGGTKRHIKTVLLEDDIWAIDHEGEDVILIGRNPAEFDLLDND